MAKPSPGIHCEGCEAPCCTHYRVTLSGTDLARLMDYTGDAAEDIVVPHEAPREDLYSGFRLDKSDTLIELALAKVDGSPRGAACRYLRRAPDGAGLCEVYPARPGACRAFPVTVIGLQQAVFTEALCPEERLDRPALTTSASWRTLIASMDVERVGHEVIAAEWNRDFIRSGRATAPLPELLEHLLRRTQELRGELEELNPLDTSTRHRAGTNPLLDQGH